MHRLSRCAVRQFHTQLRLSLRPGLPYFFAASKKLFTTGSRLLKGNDGRTKRDVRWYEHLLGSSRKEEVEFDDADEEEETRELKKRILQLEEELKDLQSGKSLALLSPEDQAKVRKAREEEARRSSGSHEQQEPPTEENDFAQDEALAELEDETGYVPNQGELEITFRLQEEQNTRLQLLNQALRIAAANTSGRRARQELWGHYYRCRLRIPQLVEQIPDAAWDILWESQYKAPATEKDRSKNLLVLLEDMRKSEKDLSPPQKLALMESYQAVGHYGKARDIWHAEQEALRDDPMARQHIEDLGVRIFASCGNPRMAQDLAFRFLGSVNDNRARVLIPVVEAWARKVDEDSIRSAWALYLNLRLRLASRMTISDFDAIMMSFLNAGRADLALAVFKDLMLSGKKSEYDSTQLYAAAIGRLDGLQPNDANQLLSKASLTALTFLPRRHQNKFFYGSWMKRLLELGQVTAASAVLELMYERGVKPEPRHLNGIIGAYLRGGSMANKDKAIQIGWAMVQERLDFVVRRRGMIASEGTAEVSVMQHQDIRIPHHLQRTVPPATIETFSLLLLYYERRSMPSYVQHLQACLRAAEIQPNSFFMNHVLYAELRQGNLVTIWKLYNNMTKRVRPDLETYACLWDSEKAHLDKLDIYATDRFPGPRQIFCEMMNWLSKISEKERRTAREEFSREMYDQIIRCFCLAKDLEGTIVALYSLRTSFNTFPSLDTVRMLTLQVARFAEDQPKLKRRQRHRLSDNPRSKANISHAMRILEAITEEREEALEEQKILVSSLSEEAQAEEHLFRLAQFLRAILHRVRSQAPVGEGDLEKVAWEMGAGGIVMQDPTCPPSLE